MHSCTSISPDNFAIENIPTHTQIFYKKDNVKLNLNGYGISDIRLGQNKSSYYRLLFYKFCESSINKNKFYVSQYAYDCRYEMFKIRVHDIQYDCILITLMEKAPWLHHYKKELFNVFEESISSNFQDYIVYIDNFSFSSCHKLHIRKKAIYRLLTEPQYEQWMKDHPETEMIIYRP